MGKEKQKPENRKEKEFFIPAVPIQGYGHGTSPDA